MADNRNNWNIGSVKVIYGGNELGYTGEDTEIEFTEERAPITVDGFGTSLISETVVGRGITVTGTFKQVTTDELSAGGTWSNLSLLNDTADANKTIFDHATNEDYYSVAQECVLRRRKDGADTTKDFFIYKASLKFNGPIPMNNSDMWVIPFEITAYVDDSGNLGGFGDSDG